MHSLRCRVHAHLATAFPLMQACARHTPKQLLKAGTLLFETSSTDPLQTPRPLQGLPGSHPVGKFSLSGRPGGTFRPITALVQPIRACQVAPCQVATGEGNLGGAEWNAVVAEQIERSLQEAVGDRSAAELARGRCMVMQSPGTGYAMHTNALADHDGPEVPVTPLNSWCPELRCG